MLAHTYPCTPDHRTAAPTPSYAIGWSWVVSVSDGSHWGSTASGGPFLHVFCNAVRACTASTYNIELDHRAHEQWTLERLDQRMCAWGGQRSCIPHSCSPSAQTPCVPRAQLRRMHGLQQNSIVTPRTPRPECWCSHSTSGCARMVLLLPVAMMRQRQLSA